jgi:hypothetical protein
MIDTLLHIFPCVEVKKDEIRMSLGSYRQISQWVHKFVEKLQTLINNRHH